MRLLLLCLSLLLSGAVLAQADLEVSLFDLLNGEPLSQKTVTLSNPDIGLSREKVTSAQGKVRFSGLSTAGAYRVTVAESENHQSVTSDPVILRSNQKSSVILEVPQKQEFRSETVTVVSNATTRINTVDAEVSAQLRSEEIEVLPIEGRDLTRALYRLPNVTQATGFFPEAPNVSINGANSLYANYLIDGLDNNENFLGGQKFAIPVGAAQDVTILTNNYSAEFGLTGNGIINITTRSGSNEVTGEGFYLTRPGPAIDGESPFAQRDLSGNQVKDGFQRHQGGFSIGGPLVRDKTFFYLNAEQTLDFKDNLLRSPDLGVNETVAGQNRFSYFSGKLDHNWSGRLKSSLRVNAGLVALERQGGGLEGGVTFPSAGNAQDRNSLLIASRNVYVGENYLSETSLQFSRFRWNYADPENRDDPNVTVLGPNDQTVAVLGHPGYQFNSLENTVQFDQKFNLTRGNHSFKVGGGVLSMDHQLTGGGNPNGSYTVRLDQNQLDALRSRGLGADLSVSDIPAGAEVLFYGVELRPASFGTRQNVFSLYAEDLISVNSRLNLTLGLRYDYDNLSKGGSSSGDLNNIAPRTSFNYKLDSRSSIRGGYGIFYEKILYALYSDALQFNSTSADYRAQLQALINQGILPEDTDISSIIHEGNLVGTFPNTAYLQGPSAASLQGQREGIFSNELRILNPDGYQNPYTHQLSLGYQYQVDSDKLFTIDLMHTRSESLYRLRALNAPANFDYSEVRDGGDVRSQAEADATRPVPIYSDATGSYALVNGDTLRGAARNVVMTETAGKSRYYAATVNFQKFRGDDAYAYRLNYTLSSLKNDTEDINFRAMDANNFDDEWGYSINDRRHVINGSFQYYPMKHLALSMAMLLQSGQPINRIPDAAIYGTTDLNGDGRAFSDAYVGNSDRSPGEERNSDRLPWSNTFDASLVYNLPIAGGRGIELRADIFNLFNAENLSGYSNNATQSNQIQVGPASSGVLVIRNAAPPRQFQFGVRYLF
ncbi:MAG TPA: TonB-dependent receptor [Calditrichia bacterium]|nr:TonB-dependent receptor [Calditrichia bacterium]